jgi:hypothetical protein
MGKYTVTAGQNLFDVALHIYGSIEGVTDLMMNNVFLSLAAGLKAGDELEFTDGFVINPAIVATFRMNGTVPANGERQVYHKETTLPKVFKLQLNSAQTSAGFAVSGNGKMEIDWGDNSPMEPLTLSNTRQSISHSFDSVLAGRRNITVYGDFSIQEIDWTDLQAIALFLFRPVAVEKFILKNSRANLAFMPLIKEVYEINLSGLKTASLLPLLENRNILSLDLSNTNIKGESIDRYLIELVRQHGNRRSCTLILTEPPSGEYKEPERDENGHYLLSSGMEAVWVLCNEPAWNEAGCWKFIIGDAVYTEVIT